MEYYSLYVTLKGIEETCERIKVSSFLMSSLQMKTEYFNKKFFLSVLECVKNLELTTSSASCAQYFGVKEEFVKVLVDPIKEEEFLGQMAKYFKEFDGLGKSRSYEVRGLDLNKESGERRGLAGDGNDPPNIFSIQTARGKRNREPVSRDMENSEGNNLNQRTISSNMAVPLAVQNNTIPIQMSSLKSPFSIGDIRGISSYNIIANNELYKSPNPSSSPNNNNSPSIDPTTINTLQSTSNPPHLTTPPSSNNSQNSNNLLNSNPLPNRQINLRNTKSNRYLVTKKIVNTKDLSMYPQPNSNIFDPDYSYKPS